MVSARAAPVPPAKFFRHIAADATGAAASDTGFIKMPDPKDDPKSSEWRPYIFARDQWHCRICGDRFLYSEMVRKHIANEHTRPCRRASTSTSTAQIGSVKRHVCWLIPKMALA